MVKYALDGESEFSKEIVTLYLVHLVVGDLKQPKAWIPIGKVKKLFIYPVKSCKGLKVDSFITSKHAAESGGLVDR